MHESTHQSESHGGRRSRPTAMLVVGFALLGALAVAVLGLVTFGVQATGEPRDLPLAVGPADPAAASALAPVIKQVSGQGGDRVEWTVVDSTDQAKTRLDDKDVYGALLLAPREDGQGLRATVLVSGAINQSGTQVAQQILSQAGETVVTMSQAQAAAQGGQGASGQGAPGQPAQGGSGAAPNPADIEPNVTVTTIHPASPAGRALPIAASALLWLATLVPSILGAIALPRLTAGRRLGAGSRIGLAAVSAITATGLVFGFAVLWDSGLPLTWSLAWFLLLVAAAFALLQAAVLRLLGLRGLAVLGPLYLVAPVIAGQVPELLHPAYRTLLWSWSPFRFSTEGVRSLLYLGTDAPDIPVALWVFGAIAVAGLVVAIWPRRPRHTGESTAAAGVDRTPETAAVG